jgi:hypothetical protein
MTGGQVAAALRGRGYEGTLIGVTGNTGAADLEVFAANGLDGGMSWLLYYLTVLCNMRLLAGVITKPINIQQLLSIIHHNARVHTASRVAPSSDGVERQPSPRSNQPQPLVSDVGSSALLSHTRMQQ